MVNVIGVCVNGHLYNNKESEMSHTADHLSDLVLGEIKAAEDELRCKVVCLVTPQAFSGSPWLQKWPAFGLGNEHGRCTDPCSPSVGAKFFSISIVKLILYTSSCKTTCVIRGGTVSCQRFGTSFLSGKQVELTEIKTPLARRNTFFSSDLNSLPPIRFQTRKRFVQTYEKKHCNYLCLLLFFFAQRLFNFSQPPPKFECQKRVWGINSLQQLVKKHRLWLVVRLAEQGIAGRHLDRKFRLWLWW